MKKLILKITFLLLLSGNIYGQSANELDVDSIPQRGLYFCWAATFEMIMKYPKVNTLPRVTVNQCDLAYYWSVNYLSPPQPTKKCCANLCKGNCVPYDGICDLCDQAIQYKKRTVDIPYCDKVLSAFGFKSTEKVNSGRDKLSFETIKSQIDANKPMAVVFVMTDADISGPHFTVIKGYVAETSQDTFISIFDPWKPCIGGTVLVNIRAFDSSTEGRYLRVESYIQDITKRIQPPPMKPMMVILDTNSLSKNTASIYAHGITKPIKPAEFDDLKIKIPVKYVNPNDLSYLINGSRDSCGRNSNVFDVSQSNDPTVMTTMQYIPRQERWIPMEIQRYPYPTKLAVKIGNDIVTLNNRVGAPNSQCFEHIIISGTHYEFYRFIYLGKPYLLPIEQTSDLLINNQKTYQYSAYTANDMTKALKKALANRSQAMRLIAN